MTKEKRNIPLNLIDPPSIPSRKSIDDNETMELARSIRSMGPIHDPVVKRVGDRYEIVAGHRRWLAHHILGSIMVVCDITDAPEEKVEAVKAAENIIRKNLTPLEEARAVKALQDAQNLDVRQLHALIGKGEAWIRLRLEMLNWPPEFLCALQDREIKVSTARHLVKIDDVEYRQYLLIQAVKNGITENTAMCWLQHWLATKDDVPVSDIPEEERLKMADQRVVVTIPCFRCERMMSMEFMVIVRICRDCYKQLVEPQ